jgi:hypothetical protein
MVVRFFAKRLALIAAIFSTDIASESDLLKIVKICIIMYYKHIHFFQFIQDHFRLGIKSLNNCTMPQL